MTLVKTIAFLALVTACGAKAPPVAPAPPPPAATSNPTPSSCDESDPNCLAWDSNCTCTSYRDDGTAGDDDDDDDDSN